MKLEIIYGVVIGIVGSGYLLLVHYWQPENVEMFNVLVLIIPIFGIYFGILHKRNRDFGGYIRYWQGLRAGLNISFVMSLVAAGYQLVYQTVLNPEFSQQMVEVAREYAIESGKSPEQTEAFIESVKTHFNTTTFVLQSFFIAIVWGGFVSLMEATFVKRKPPKEKNSPKP